MPVYMDRHAAAGVSLAEALAVHELDLAVQAKHGCQSRTFWLDEARGFLNCLVEAPAKEMVVAMHSEAHGQIPSEIMEVHPELVFAFLGRLDDLSSETSTTPAIDSAFRCIMFTDLKDSTAMTVRLGDLRAMELIRTHDAIVRGALAKQGGREVKHTGDGIMAAFVTAPDAVACAIDIGRGFANYNAANPEVELHVRIGLSAGEPVVQNNDLFGTAVQLAARLCAHAQPDEVLVSDAVRNVCPELPALFMPRGEQQLKGFDGAVTVYSVAWRETE
jgi:class 3 adenylate cyclase